MTVERERPSKQVNKGYAHEIPPQEKYVIIYFSQKGISESAAKSFFLYFSQLHWKSEGGIPVKNWKALANEWIWRNFEV